MTDGSRDREPEPAALARLAVHADRAAHQRRQLLRNHKAESGTAILAGIGFVDLAELAEQLLLVFRCDADAAVPDHEFHSHVALLHLVTVDALADDADIAVVRELDRVADEIRQYLAEPHRVSPHDIGDVVGYRVADRQLLALRLCGKQLRHVREFFAYRELDGFEHQLAGFDLGEIEHRIDDLQERHARRVHDLRVLLLLGRQVRAQEQARHADDAVHRRTDLVAHVGQELALGVARRVRLVARDCQLAAALLRLRFARGQLARAVRDHACEHYRPLFELVTIANDECGDEAERRNENHDDQDVEQEDPLAVLRDDPVDLLRDGRGQRENLAEHGIEFLVQVTANHAGGVARIPALGKNAVELGDVLAQQLQVLPCLRQHRYLAERRVAAVDRRTDEELRGLDLGAHVVINADVSIAAERFFEPQVRRRYFLLHGLHQAHEERIALEVPGDEPLRVNHDGNRYEAYGNNTYDKRF